MNKILSIASFAVVLALAACDQQKSSSEPQQAAPAMPQASAPATPAASSAAPGLLSPATLNEKAPAVYKARFKTTKGDFVIEVNRDWAPHGADRFYNLVKNGFYDDVAFFRVVPGFMVQFGVTGNPDVNEVWQNAHIPDDAVKQSNKPGMVTFATAGPNTRTTQVFINYGENGGLDAQGFAPFGKIVSGMDVIKALHGGYGDGPPFGRGPDQGRIQREGNAFLKRDYASLDYSTKATIE
jgi:peptidyl-prolyl cis-trans isomerase A (cyclophilin A)